MHEECPHALTHRTCAICWPVMRRAINADATLRRATESGRELALYSRDHSGYEDRSPSMRRGPDFAGLWSGGKRGKGWG